jgi:hypothetical protein
MAEPPADGMFSLGAARAELAALRPMLDDFLALRAELAELRADLQNGGGNLADAKGMEARLYAELEHFTSRGAQVKGYAPLLLDWPGERDGTPVLWCWLEGEPDIAWYHRMDSGFAGRRPI